MTKEKITTFECCPNCLVLCVYMENDSWHLMMVDGRGRWIKPDRHVNAFYCPHCGKKLHWPYSVKGQKQLRKGLKKLRKDNQ